MSPIRRILVPVDFSESSRAALDYAVGLARGFDAQVDVLHVWEVPSFAPPGTVMFTSGGTPLPNIVRTAAEEALEGFVSAAAKRGVAVHSSRTEQGHPVQAIIEAATSGKYDLIVLGTHGRTGLSRALIGSVAERVVRHAPCPTLTVRSPRTA